MRITKFTYHILPVGVVVRLVLRPGLILFAVVRIVLERIPSALRPSILEIISHSKSSQSQKRALLLKQGLLRSTADELEALADTGIYRVQNFVHLLKKISDEDLDALITKLDKVSPSLTNLLRPIVEEIKETIQYAVLTGVTRPISFRPLMLGNHHIHFKNGILVEVVRKNKRMDVLAVGGRYVFVVFLQLSLYPTELSQL